MMKFFALTSLIMLWRLLKLIDWWLLMTLYCLCMINEWYAWIINLWMLTCFMTVWCICMINVLYIWIYNRWMFIIMIHALKWLFKVFGIIKWSWNRSKLNFHIDGPFLISKSISLCKYIFLVWFRYSLGEYVDSNMILGLYN